MAVHHRQRYDRDLSGESIVSVQSVAPTDLTFFHSVSVLLSFPIHAILKAIANAHLTTASESLTFIHISSIYLHPLLQTLLPYDSSSRANSAFVFQCCCCPLNPFTLRSPSSRAFKIRQSSYQHPRRITKHSKSCSMHNIRSHTLILGILARLLPTTYAQTAAPVTTNNPPGVQYVAVFPGVGSPSGSIVASSNLNGSGVNFQISIYNLSSEGGPFCQSDVSPFIHGCC